MISLDVLAIAKFFFRIAEKSKIPADATKETITKEKKDF